MGTMIQDAKMLIGEDAMWVTLQIASITILYFVLRHFVAGYRWLLSQMRRSSPKQMVSLCDLSVSVLSFFD